MDGRQVPANWSSTSNALELLAFHAKEALLVVDDFAPAGGRVDVQRLHGAADRILRAQGNRSGRQRMTQDAALRDGKAPRGLIVSTGEDLPNGHSLRARILMLEVSPKEIDADLLSAAQEKARAGLHAGAMAGYLKWLAADLARIRAKLAERVKFLREQFASSTGHRRSADMLANLLTGIELLLEFALAIGAISTKEVADLLTRAFAGLEQAGLAQEVHQVAADPVDQYMLFLRAAFAGKRAHLVDKDGRVPVEPRSWGWTEDIGGSHNGAGGCWRPGGERIGWVDGPDVYLEAELALAAVQALAQRQGGGFPINGKTLHKRFKERGLLASTDPRRGTHLVRRVLEGGRKQVLHFRSTALVPAEPDQPDQSDQVQLG
jgi:hypothetical protein